MHSFLETQKSMSNLVFPRYLAKNCLFTIPLIFHLFFCSAPKLTPGLLTFCGRGFLFAASRRENMGVNGRSSDYFPSTFAQLFIPFSSERCENKTLVFRKVNKLADPVHTSNGIHHMARAILNRKQVAKRKGEV